jgi:nucleoside-diphosphate-sugar epimerase
VLAANTSSFRTIAIRPPAIWGPGDPFSRGLPDAIASGRFAFIERGDYPFAICHVDVDNVIEAVQCALERGTGGRAYFIKDRETTTFRDFIAMLADLQDLSVSGLKSVSYRLAFTIGWLMEVGAAIRFSKNDPSWSRKWCG